ncbi:MAG: folate-binding protein [Acidobacteriota bacterium]
MTTEIDRRPDDLTALHGAVGLIDLSFRGRLELIGADRLRFLNGQVTCEVKSLAAGSGTYGFFTTGQGKVMADFGLLAFEDRLWLDLPAGLDDEIAAHLAKYLIADRVEVKRLDGVVPLALVGPGLSAVLPDLSSLPEGEWGHGKVEIGGVEVELSRHPHFGAPGAVAWVAAESAGRLTEALSERGARPVSFEAVEILRVEAGLPRFGVDFGPENFPQETGQEEAAVSYTKGCYLGQEVVARIHYRGGVQRSMRGLRFEGEIPERGAPLSFEGREAGTVGSTVKSPRFGGIGLAVIHKRGAAAGTRLTLPDGALAEVVDLPFS